MKKYFLLILVAGIIFNASAELKLEGRFNWNSPQVKKLCPGIEYVQFEQRSPRILKMAAVRVDLTTPGLRFQMSQRDKDWGKPMPGFEKKYVIRTKRKTCRQFMEEFVARGDNMVVAVNATPFGPWEPPWTHTYADGQGLLIDNGILVAPPIRKRPGFIAKKDGTFTFATFNKDDDLSHIKHAISGFSTILEKGKIIARKDERLAPRTGYGLSADCKTFYILTADGRQPQYSMGLSQYEVAEMLYYLGASDALNMDGGGSTTLYIRDQAGMKRLTHYINGYERLVGGALGIIIDKENKK